MDRILIEDTIMIIASELLLWPGALANFSSTSRKYRTVTTPILFARCVADVHGSLGIPPETIRSFIHYLTYVDITCSEFELRIEAFGPELPYLPALRSITFNAPALGYPWPAIERCLRVPSLIALSIKHKTGFAKIDPFPDDITSVSIALSQFSYIASIWREVTNEPKYPINMAQGTRMPYDEEVALERQCLALFIPRLQHTVESLTIPFETAPLAHMAKLSWFKLRELAFRGCCHDVAALHPLRVLLDRTGPKLSTLCLLLCSPAKGGRLRFFSPDSKPQQSLELKSLTLAYPDISDSIFDVVGPQLTHLSLRDFPRLYNHRASALIAHKWVAPILSSSEVLSILKRLSLSLLTRLEIVYLWDETEDELLSYITHALPSLSQLELHRYRRTEPYEIVPYTHIAEVLAAASAPLRRIELNLDFEDSPGPGCTFLKIPVDAYHGIHCEHGRAITGILRAGLPLLECLTLLFHEAGGSQWISFIPDRYKTSCRIHEYWDSYTLPPMMQNPEMTRWKCGPDWLGSECRQT